MSLSQGAVPALRRRGLAAGLAGLLLAAASGAPARAQEGTVAAPRPLRAAQILLFRAGTMAEVEANLLRLKDAGVDTVILRVFQNRWDRPLLWSAGTRPPSPGVYFRTAAAPVVADHLGPIAALCRRHGLSLFAWMTTRSCDWLLEAEPELAERRYDPARGAVVPASGLNLFHPRVRRHLLALYRDLARADIDGVLFQDDLVLRAGEGLSPEAIAAFIEEEGTAVSPEVLFRPEFLRRPAAVFSADSFTPAFWRWAAWKNRRLLLIAEDLMAAARGVRPELRFALNLYYETVLNPRMALAWYAQSLAAAEGYPFDYYSLMSYHRQIARELSFSPGEALRAVGALGRTAAGAVSSPAKVILKIQSLDWDTSRPLPAEELDEALAAARVPGVGLAFVRSLDDPPLEVVRRHFRAAP